MKENKINSITGTNLFMVCDLNKSRLSTTDTSTTHTHKVRRKSVNKTIQNEAEPGVV